MSTHERGSAGILSMVIALVVVGLAIYLFTRSGTGPAEQAASAVDEARIVEVQQQLRLIKQGLELARSASQAPAYPRTAEINSLQELREALGSYASIPDPAPFTFGSYASDAPDAFRLEVAVRGTPDVRLEVGSDLPPRRLVP